MKEFILHVYKNYSPFCNLSNNSIDLLTSIKKRQKSNKHHLFVLIEADQNLPLANVRGSPMVAILFDYTKSVIFFPITPRRVYMCQAKIFQHTVFICDCKIKFE